MRIAVIGAGHAGVAAAEAAAKQGAEVVLFSAESALPYFRPRIVGVAVGREAEEAILFHPREWFEARGIELRLGAPVESVERVDAGFVVRAGGKDERVDRLVLATGACPFTPPLYATKRERLSPLWTLADARALSAKLVPGTRLCVIGGGILGLELALGAAARPGVSVTVVEREDRLMRAQLSDLVSGALRDNLTRRGVEVVTNACVERFEEVPGALRLCFADGGVREFEQVVYALGARACLDLARVCGLEVGRGVRVDGSLATSVEGVWACGDVVEVDGVTRSVALEAVKQGRVAGENAAGGKAVYRSVGAALSYRHPDLEILAIGAAQPEGSCLREVPTEKGLCVLVIQDGLLVGVQALDAREAFRQHEKRLGQAVDGAGEGA